MRPGACNIGNGCIMTLTRIIADQSLLISNIILTRLRSKVFSLEKTLVLTWFYKGSILFCFLGGGSGGGWPLNYLTYVRSICQILASY